MWIVWTLKALCILNICGFIYRLPLLFKSILYFKSFFVENAMNLFLLFSITFIIYSIYLLMNHIIELQTQLLKDMVEIKYIVKKLYDACELEEHRMTN